MIRTAIYLARTSLLSVLFLAAALLTLVTVLSDTPDDGSVAEPALAAALMPGPKPRPQTGDAPAALRVALFDPERRPETIAGSIDDLRGLVAAPPPANVVISGVLIDGPVAKAMLAVTGGPPTWGGVGTEVGGWRIASISPEGAVLEHDGRSLSLKIADRLKVRERTRPGPDANAASASTPIPDGAPPGATPPDPMTPPDQIEPPKP